MINIITGKPGCGKTYYLAKLVYEKLLPKGVEVWSYKRLRFNDDRVKYFDNIDEIKHLRNVVIILDEAQIWFNARNWESLDVGLQYSLQQHRHKGIDIYGAVQNIKRIDCVMRELVNRYYEVKNVCGSRIKNGVKPKRVWGLFLLREFFPEDANLKTKKSLSIKPYFLRKKICDFYDTQAHYEETETNENVKSVKLWTCPTCKKSKIIGG